MFGIDNPTNLSGFVGWPTIAPLWSSGACSCPALTCAYSVGGGVLARTIGRISEGGAVVRTGGAAAFLGATLRVLELHCR